MTLDEAIYMGISACNQVVADDPTRRFDGYPEAAAALALIRACVQPEAVAFVEAAKAIWESEELIFHDGGSVEIPNALATRFADTARTLLAAQEKGEGA